MTTCSCKWCEYTPTTIRCDTEKGYSEEGPYFWAFRCPFMQSFCQPGFCSVVIFCPKCGDHLLPGGEVESRTELKAKAAALGTLEALLYQMLPPPIIQGQLVGGNDSRERGWGIMVEPGKERRGTTLLALAEQLSDAPEAKVAS